MNFHVDIQNVSQCTHLPEPSEFDKWVRCVLSNHLESAEVLIRVVNRQESQMLNHQYRQIDAPTNILSFHYDLPEELLTECPLLGDLVFCDELIEKEAKERNIPIVSHWAHLTIHGLLHLLAFDHETEKGAEQMEGLEIQYLKSLGYANPYLRETQYEL